MKEMTSAEFARANLAELDEPVRIRRYTKTVGTYYPDGYEPSVAEPPPQVALPLDEIAPSSVKASQKVLEELTEEIARLKRELARRSIAEPTWRTSTGGDPFAGLAKQDRDFFERKLGGKKK